MKIIYPRTDPVDSILHALPYTSTCYRCDGKDSIRVRFATDFCAKHVSFVSNIKNMSHYFIQNCLLDNSASFTLSKMEGKTNFFEAPTGCQEPGFLSVWKSLTSGII